MAAMKHEEMLDYLKKQGLEISDSELHRVLLRNGWAEHVDKTLRQQEELRRMVVPPQELAVWSVYGQNQRDGDLPRGRQSGCGLADGEFSFESVFEDGDDGSMAVTGSNNTNVGSSRAEEERGDDNTDGDGTNDVDMDGRFWSESSERPIRDDIALLLRTFWLG